LISRGEAALSVPGCKSFCNPFIQSCCYTNLSPCLLTPPASCVEANLLIICASLPTLRIFFRTVAPNLMSSDANGSTKSGELGGVSGTHGVQTIGGSGGFKINPKRQYYGRFDDDEYHMETMVTVGERDKDLEAGRNGDVGDGLHPFGSKEWNEDGTSEAGFVQAKTTNVTYTEAR
jgi:hypothetical protein